MISCFFLIYLLAYSLMTQFIFSYFYLLINVFLKLIIAVVFYLIPQIGYTANTHRVG